MGRGKMSEREGKDRIGEGIQEAVECQEEEGEWLLSKKIGTSQREVHQVSGTSQISSQRERW